MNETINWLHFSDLHFGLDQANWLYPKLRRDLYNDLERRAEGTDGWDLVFFTGDFVQAGTKPQFAAFDDELAKLWKVLSRSGKEPMLCIVPGNHDLVRPAPGAASLALKKFWWQTAEVRANFWSSPTSEYRALVDEMFANYESWRRRASVPMLASKLGLLPGDFSSIYCKNDVKLGIVGLNTTFLQIGDEVKEGFLDAHVSQLNAVCDMDPSRWVDDTTMSIILTHQPPGWLHPSALDQFRQEIYPSGRFFAQYCGHQHDPRAWNESEGGSAARRLRVAASLFGLERWEGTEPKERIHGYTAGQFHFEQSGSFEKYWPRRAVKVRSGDLRIQPDTSFDLNDHGCVVSRIPDEEVRIVGAEPPQTPAAPPKPIIGSSEDSPVRDTGADSFKELDTCPRFAGRSNQSHRSIRADEQAQLRSILSTQRVAWLVAEWGVGSDEFLATYLDSTPKAESPIAVFVFDFEEISEPDAIEGAFQQQFGMALQSFCNIVAPLEQTWLILNWVPPHLMATAGAKRLDRIIHAIVDYCPRLSMVVISPAQPIPEITSDYVKLSPLDIPDTRTYIANASRGREYADDVESVVTLHELADGLPVHLDRLLDELQVTTLSSLADAEYGGAWKVDASKGLIPRSLVGAVTRLATSADDTSARSFKLLKVLSLLPYGESISVLRHVLPTEPFFPDHALQLNAAGLLEIIQLQHNVSRVAYRGKQINDPPKILKVPRQVRDYVVGLMSDAEREEMIISSIDRLFGRRWRDGHVNFRMVPPEHRAYMSSGAGNEFALIQRLSSLGGSDEASLRRTQAVQLALQYARRLESDDRYRDLARVAGDLLRIVDSSGNPEIYAELASLYGEGLRMISRVEDALGYLREALKVGADVWRDDRKADVWISIALAEQEQDRLDAALEAAETAKALAGRKSSNALFAAAIIADISLTGDERIKTFEKIERIARREKHLSVANNVALQLAETDDGTADRAAYLDAVLKSADSGYTKARAVILRVHDLARRRGYAAVAPTDVSTLCTAYSYLYAQRFAALFDDCNSELWDVFEARNQIESLIQLFRHTSFIWRIRGEEGQEAQYLKRLHARSPNPAFGPVTGIIVMELKYFVKRLTALAIG